MLSDLRQTLVASTQLTQEVTRTVDAVDRIAKRFQRQPADQAESLDIINLRDTIVAIGDSAQKTARLLEAAGVLVETETWQARADEFDAATTRLINLAFTRAPILILALLAGTPLIGCIPARRARPAAP